MDITYPFTPGTRAVAQQVNQNFADVKSAVDPLEIAVSNIETQLSTGIILPDGSVDFTRLQSYKTYTVSNATNATPIVVTAVAHDFITGDKVFISGVGGNTAANGVFTITKIGVDTFSLDGSVGNGSFTSNGTAIIYPSADNNLVNKVYVDTKQLLDLGTVTTETTLTTGKITLADFSGAVNLVIPSNLPLGVEHTAVVNFTTVSSSQPTISTSGTLKWSDKNQGKAPTAYSIISGVRNILVFKTHDGGSIWEAEYSTFGGVETAYTQPVLTANGTLGGTTTAIATSSNNTGSGKSISDGNTGTYWQSTTLASWFKYYEPNPIKISTIGFNTNSMRNYTLYGSNDDLIYTALTTGDRTSIGDTVTIPEGNRGYYKYYKMENSTLNTGTLATIYEMYITATVIAV